MSAVYLLEKLLVGLEEEIVDALRRLRGKFPKHHRFRQKVEQVLFIIIDNQTFILMSNLNLKPGKRYAITPGLIDSISKAPVPGAQLTNKVSSVADSTIALVDSDGKLRYVTKGSTALTVVGSWSYTDGNTGDTVNVDKTSVVTITCLAVAEVVEQTVDLTDEEDIPADVPPVGDGGAGTTQP